MINLLTLMSVIGIMTFADTGKAPLSSDDLLETEAAIMSTCLENEKNDSTACRCFFDSLKQETPAKDYQKLMRVLTYITKGDIAQVIGMAFMYDIMIEDIEKLVERINQSAERAKRRCGTYLDFDLKLNVEKETV